MAAIEISVPVNVSMTPQEIHIPVDIDASLLDGGWITETETLQDGSRIVTYYKTDGRPHGKRYYDPLGALTRVDIYDWWRETEGWGWSTRLTEMTLGAATVTEKSCRWTQTQGVIVMTTETVDATIRHAQRVFQAWPEEELLPIGYTINMPWENDIGTSYDNPMILVTYGKFQKEGDPETTLTWMGVFMSQYAQSAVPFDGSEREEATEETAQTGLHYYGRTGSTYTVLELEDGDPVPYGDYDHIYHNEIDNISTRRGDPLIRWGHSAMRQYLNSDGAAGTWWSAQHIGDCAPSNVSGRRGYLAGLLTEDAGALNTIRVRTQGEDADTAVFDRVWIPSPWEMYGQNGQAASMDFDTYWQDVVGITGSHRDIAIEERATMLLTIQTSAANVVLRYDYGTIGFGAMCVYGSDASYGSQSFAKGQIARSRTGAGSSNPMRVCVAVG